MISLPRKLVPALSLASLCFLWGCSDARNTLSPQRRLPSEGGRLQAMTSCGASFRVITDETDSLMTAYGIGKGSDTVDVCETWVGSDYDYQVTGAGSSDNVPGFADTVQTLTYQSAYLTGYTQSGAAAANPTNVGTMFDFMLADNPTRQASYDYPYYGMSSPDPSACLQPPCPVTMRAPDPPTAASQSMLAPAQTKSNAVIQDTLFTKHGLTRRGVRALVNTSEEITPSPQGYRRFRVVKGDVTTVRSIDPVTQLLMAEESTSPSETMTVNHKWTKILGGYVLDRSDYVSVESINGRQIRNVGSMQIKNARINDPQFGSLSLPTASH